MYLKNRLKLYYNYTVRNILISKINYININKIITLKQLKLLISTKKKK
jgi:hypothetical protein